MLYDTNFCKNNTDLLNQLGVHKKKNPFWHPVKRHVHAVKKKWYVPMATWIRNKLMYIIKPRSIPCSSLL
jgi:hypothetical protein